MKTLDFKLRYLLEKAIEPTDGLVRVVLEFKDDLSAACSLGFFPVTTIGNISTGSIPLNRLKQLGALPNIVAVEGSSFFKEEASVRPNANNLTLPNQERRTVPGLGRGSLIGFIDSGFDLTHPCFSDASGKTRIVAAWDQLNLRRAAGSPPDGLDYGVEYQPELINRCLLERTPLIMKNHGAAGAHGTMVAGIAAGNGAPHDDYQGVAPEAELVFVTYRNDTPIGSSAFIIDAIEYILRKARARRRPVVVNLSQGDNLGAHDGSSLLEKAIDLYVEREGVLIVTSAGNEREGQRHARGRVTQGLDYYLPFEIREEAGRAAAGDIIDLWYCREDRFAVALSATVGLQSEFVPPDAEKFISLGDGSRAYVCSETNNPRNGQNRITIVFEKGPGWKPGRRELILRGLSVVRGEFDAWADLPDAVTLISFLSHTDDCTLTIPGTARNAITTSGFTPEGSLAPLTSLGPTRDGRLKPDLTAPGFSVLAPTTCRNGGAGPCNYVAANGTSMAAPHIAGVVALLLGQDPHLTANHVRQALLSTARVDSFTGAVPNQSWGWGKLDAGAAYEALSKKWR